MSLAARAKRIGASDATAIRRSPQGSIRLNDKVRIRGEARVPPQKILKTPLSAQLGIDETSSDALNEMDAEVDSENSSAPEETGGQSQVCESSVARPPAAADAASGEGSLATGARDEGQAKAVIAQVPEPALSCLDVRPLIKGYFSALRWSWVRSCLRPLTRRIESAGPDVVR